jgi:DNA-binding NarL/FixJ family response regulator
MMQSNMISENNFYTFSVDRHVNDFAQIGPKGKSMKIFLVDDSMVIRQRLKRLLADMKEVTVIGESGNAQEATDAILEQKPDVVLLDIHLLDGSGIDVLQRLKKTSPAPAVIILTNYPYPQYRQKCLEAGADFFFVKSTEFDQVVPALRQLIQQASDAGAGPRMG